MSGISEQHLPDRASEARSATIAGMWEQRHKHAAFYQTQVSAVQQAALASNTTGALVVTLAVAMSKMSGVGDGQDWAAIFMGVLGWLALTVLLTEGYSQSARRVEGAYRREHELLFPDAKPYRLESYLLRYPEQKARWWKRTRDASS